MKINIHTTCDDPITLGSFEFPEAPNKGDVVFFSYKDLTIEQEVEYRVFHFSDDPNTNSVDIYIDGKTILNKS